MSEDNEEHREKILSQLLSKLKDHEKKVIELRYLRNYSVAEVAQKLHISINNVKVITYRTLHKLQKIALTFRKV